MMNRITQKIDGLRATGGKSLTVVIMIADPDIETTFELVKIASDVGVDAIELGIPIADPFLDSDVMRKSMVRALAHTQDYKVYIATLGKLREKYPDMPFEVMIYHATAMTIGLDNFCKSVVDTGMDAVLVADGVFKGREYLTGLDRKLLDKGVIPIRFVPHPFDPGQIDDLRNNAHGFIVVQTKADSKGERTVVLDENKVVLDGIRNGGVKIPLVMAYGIKTPADIQKCISMGADGVLIGTVLLEAAHRLSMTEFHSLLIKLRRATAGV
jgi:tryptophan synthase alpha chain